jgi:hypothetical protein
VLTAAIRQIPARMRSKLLVRVDGAGASHELSAPRGALLYRPRSGHRLEEVSVGPMTYLDP